MKHLEKKSRKGKQIKALSLAALLAASFAGMTSFFASEHANAASSTCDDLTITGLRASSDDGNIPANTIDNNLKTRWSGYGIGSWIRADLGEQKVICSVDIAWYKGDQRVNDFVIAVSADGTSYTNVYTGESSGTTINPESYNIPETEARYVMITVNGNSNNDWASITEIDVHGSSSTVISEDDSASGDNSGCEDLAIASVRASGDDGHVPSNTLDNNLGTRWSDEGVGSWITADLGVQEAICSVDIAWYRGDERVNDFVISVSSDGTSFTNVYSGESSGETTAFEKYSFQQVTARYVKVTVNGNTMNEWASITELDVNREDDTSTAGDGDTDEDTDTSGDSGTDDAGTDKFGIKELYPTKSGGDEWFMDMNDPNVDEDRFTTKDSITKNSDGSWKVEDDQIRMNVFTKSGYDPDSIDTYDQKVLAKRGYMQDPNDWKNVEITGYVKLNDFDSNGYFSWYARSGRHTHDEAPNGENQECEGTGVKPRIYYNGNTASVKELWHNEGYAVTNRIDGSTDDLEGRWIGIKTVIYNVKMPDGS
ncbi:MAG: discoidin domain-containing protein, partial [Thermoproteota archaeon]